jgi:hypothetical protein
MTQSGYQGFNARKIRYPLSAIATETIREHVHQLEVSLTEFDLMRL